MLVLIAGLIVFLSAHAVPLMPRLRSQLIAAGGVAGYRAMFSLSALLGVGLTIYGFALYRQQGWLQLWTPPLALRHLALTLMIPVFPLLIASCLPGWVRAKARYPALLAIKFWAFVHLLANGDAGGVLLFGSFLAWAVIARLAAKSRGKAPSVDAAPFGRNDIVAIAAGLGLYALVVKFLHQWLIGVTILP